MVAELKLVRPYYYGDYYPLLPCSATPIVPPIRIKSAAPPSSGRHGSSIVPKMVTAWYKRFAAIRISNLSRTCACGGWI